MKKIGWGLAVMFVSLAYVASAVAGPLPCAIPVQVVGDSAGNVTVRDLADTTLSVINLNASSIGQIDAVDVNGDGALEVLATHQDAIDLPTYCLNLPSLTQRWLTDHPTRIGILGHDDFGGRTYSGDFDGDGELELLIPLQQSFDLNSVLCQVFSALDGHRECAVPDWLGWLAIPYFDDVHSAWRLAGQKNRDAFTHDLYQYALAGCPADPECSNTSVNTWLMGAIGGSMIDGLPRIWGGWYGRTLYVTDRNCNTLWSKSFGGYYEANGVYAGDLRGDGVETLLVGGTYGTNHVRLDAAQMVDGTTLWTFDDTNADWSLHVMAVEDVNADAVKEVYVHTRGNASHPPKYQAINGLNGARLWEQPYVFGTWMVEHARLVDVNADGEKEVLLIVNNTIEARNALTGALVRTYTFGANVTAFELAGVPDLDCDGIPDAEDNCPAISNPNQADADVDGVGDLCDNCPGVSNPSQEDCDQDGVGDVCANEPDCNENGVPDECDIAAGGSTDCNRNGVPDECELISEDCPYEVGDVNNDGAVNRDDVRQFTLVLLGLDHCACSVAAADINGDGQVDHRDIRPFRRLLRCKVGYPLRSLDHEGSAAADLTSLADELGVNLDLRAMLREQIGLHTASKPQTSIGR